MPTPNPTRLYSIPGFRTALVRESGVKLAGRPRASVPAEAAAMLAQDIGEVDRGVFVIAMLTIRHRVIGLHTVSVGCLTSSLVHPREVLKPAILSGSAAILAAHYVARNIMRGLSPGCLCDLPDKPTDLPRRPQRQPPPQDGG